MCRRAQILKYGVEQPALRTEIYVQILKQLHNNPDPTRAARGWQLLMLCLLVFPPDVDLLNFVLMFLRQHAPPESAELLTRQCHAIALTSKDALATTPPDANRHAQMIHDSGMTFLQ